MGISKLGEMIDARRRREGLYSTPAFWDAKAEEYQGDAVSMWPNNNLNHFYHLEQMATMQRLLPDVQGRRVLELGCGTGRISRYLARRGAQVVGIDFSPKSIEIARMQTTGTNPRYRQGSVFELDEVAAYDCTVSWTTVTMACRSRADLLVVLRGVRKALKPGGTLLFCEPIHSGMLHRVLKMSLREFRRAMEEEGFEIRETTQIHFWPMRLALAFVPWPKPVTAAGYYLGKAAMALCGSRAFGDYKVLLARGPAKVP